MKKTLVFQFKTNYNQIGNGNYAIVACFVNLGIHVPFTIYCHSENEYIDSIGKPTKCDGSCEYSSGHMQNYSKKRCDSSFNTDNIVKAALKFKEKLKKENRFIKKDKS